MRIRLSITVLSGVAGALLIAPVFADAIYKWEDENGHPHYSDMPRDGAEELNVQPAQTFTAPRPATRTQTSEPQESEETEEVTGYNAFSITSPRAEETFWNTGGNLNLTVSMQPGLQLGHRIQTYLDGKPMGEMADGMTTTTLSNVSRGEHKVYAQVRDETGKVLGQTPAVTFYVQQSTVENNRRAKPTPPIALPTEPVTRSDLPPVSRTRRVR